MGHIRHRAGTFLDKRTVQEINLGLIARMKEQAGIHSQVVSDVMDAVAEALDVEEDVRFIPAGPPIFSSIRNWQTAAEPAS